MPDARCPERSQEGARCIHATEHDGPHFAKDAFSYYSWETHAAAVREWDEVYAIRRLVGQWLRIRAQHVHEPESVGVLPGTLGKALMHQVLTQLAADADHSEFLVRLLRGEEPLTFDEWKSR